MSFSTTAHSLRIGLCQNAIFYDEHHWLHQNVVCCPSDT